MKIYWPSDPVRDADDGGLSSHCRIETKMSKKWQTQKNRRFANVVQSRHLFRFFLSHFRCVLCGFFANMLILLNRSRRVHTNMSHGYMCASCTLLCFIFRFYSLCVHEYVRAQCVHTYVRLLHTHMIFMSHVYLPKTLEYYTFFAFSGVS